MPRYISKGGMIKCHAYQFLDNIDCEIEKLEERNPDSVKIVSYTHEPRSISVAIKDYSNTISVPLHYYLVFYDDGETSIMSPVTFRAYYLRDYRF